MVGLVCIAWGPAALYAMNLLQLWLQADEAVEEHQLKGAVQQLLSDPNVRDRDQAPARSEIGSAAWLEEEEWLETEGKRAPTVAGVCCCQCRGEVHHGHHP